MAQVCNGNSREPPGLWVIYKAWASQWQNVWTTKNCPPVLKCPLPKVLETPSVQELWHLPKQGGEEAWKGKVCQGYRILMCWLCPTQQFLAKGCGSRLGEIHSAPLALHLEVEVFCDLASWVYFVILLPGRGALGKLGASKDLRVNYSHQPRVRNE